MERKGRKTKFKKFIAILCVFVLLQSYFSYAAQIAIAISEEVNEENFITSSGVSEELKPQDGLQEEPQEDTGEDEPLVQEDPKDDSLNGNDEIPEEPVDEPQEDEPTEEPIEEEPEEPYVEPEITMEVTSEDANIYKGYLYANATSELKYATNYNTIDTVTIVGGKNMTVLTIQDEPDKMQLITNEKIGLFNQMYYRQTRINTQEFNYILGEEGSITLYNIEGEVVGYINKDTEVINDEYVFTYPVQVNSVRFEFTNILNDGTISIKNDKSIKESSDFNRNQISLFSTINTIAQGKIYKGEEVKSYSAEGNITLQETESRMLLEVDTDVLSVEHENEVTISVTLKTDEERYDLFENPTIDIEFPSVVENIDVTRVSLLYRNGLSINNWEVVTNSIGRKVLKVSLSGAQMEYTPGAAQQGTTLVLYTTIKAKRVTADTSEALRMTYTNKDTVRKTYALEGKDSEDVLMNFVGRQELIRSLTATEFDISTATTIDNKTEKIKILANQSVEQSVTVHGVVLNNYETTLDDVVIIGKIPFVGNKDENGYDLGTNFDTILQTPITSTGSIVDIYYSEDGDAKIDSDSWSTDTTDISKYKAYKLVLRDKTLAKGEGVSFEYNLTVPAGVGNNAIGYASYCTSYEIDNQTYTDICTVGIYTEMKEVEFDDIAEEDKEDITSLIIGTQVSQGGKILKEGDSVFERQILKYSIVITNVSNTDLTNLNVKANAKNANLYTWVTTEVETNTSGKVKKMTEITDGSKEYDEFNIASLPAGASKTFEYQVVVLEDVDEVYGNIIIDAEEIEEQTLTTFTTPVEKAEMEVRVSRSSTQSMDDRANLRDKPYRYELYFENLTDNELNNVKVYLNMPIEMNVNLADITYVTKEGFSYGNVGRLKATAGENSSVMFEIEKVHVNERITVNFYATVKEFDIDQEYITVNINALGETENNAYSANEVVEKFYQNKTQVEYTWKADQTKAVLENGDVVNFELTVKNVGLGRIDYLEVNSVFPSGLVVNSANYNNGTNNSIEISKNKNNLYEINFSTDIEKDGVLTVTINTTYNELLTQKDQNVLEINASATSSQLDKNILTNTISYSIVAPYTSAKEVGNNTHYTTEESVTGNNQNTQNAENNNGNNVQEQPSQPATTEQPIVENIADKNMVYEISGRVWLDSNRDGKRQESERLLKNQEISLYSANVNGGIDLSTKIASTTTNANGEYIFDSIVVGNYVVMLEHDSEKYNITKYQVDGAKQDENSDVISKMISVNGENKLVAVSDIIVINDMGLSNLDMGLTEKNIFDLSLKKYAVKAVVKNDSGTKVYNFNNSTNTKLEIRSKDYKSSIVDITYKIVVKNDGELEGYVNKIVDYLPEGIAVNLNASPGWYIGSDDGLYYNGLVGDEIKPGETREVTLVIRKDLSNGEAVSLVNQAEILEYTNAYSMTDKDSIEGNKDKKEDDFGQATINISVSTGNTVQYIIAILMIIIIVAVITMYVIKMKNTKKVFK